MLEPRPVRLYKARRAEIEARLTTAGVPEDDADLWLTAWEAYALTAGVDAQDRDFWDRGHEWIVRSRHTPEE
jgi:hypothetical protein